MTFSVRCAGVYIHFYPAVARKLREVKNANDHGHAIRGNRGIRDSLGNVSVSALLVLCLLAF